jgi:hypothetical protein
MNENWASFLAFSYQLWLSLPAISSRLIGCRLSAIGREPLGLIAESRWLIASLFRSAHLSAGKDFRQRCGKPCGKVAAFTPL